ncbi:MAG: PxKF domain-containing protein, partial [Thermoproteota archaeon]|nr:PxKF domain-containing protein [Thermoproteota archaeon]
WQECTSPVDYSGLEEGEHTFSVVAIDTAGNRGTVASFSWTVDYAPTVSINSAIDGQGNNVMESPSSNGSHLAATSDSITFEFSSPDSDVARFECRLYDQTGDGTGWQECTSPHTYSNLAEGQHYTFSVFAIDTAGNRGYEDSFLWYIQPSDTTTPEDLDRDGIQNEVDPNDSDPNNNSFETSSGTSGTLIRSSQDQNLAVVPNNEGGVTITVFSGGPVHVEACGGQEIHDLGVGESIDIVCGSIIVNVNAGNVQLILHANDGTSLTVNLQEGYELKLEPQDNTITAASSNPGSITAISENGEEITIPSGESVQTVYSIRGFYPPIDMNQVENIARAGQTIPFKFEVFLGTTEITDTDAVNFSQEAIACLNKAADGVEQTTTGNTRLAYDESSGQFVGHWKSPRTPGACYEISASVVENPSVEKTAIVKLR